MGELRSVFLRSLLVSGLVLFNLRAAATTSPEPHVYGGKINFWACSSSQKKMLVRETLDACQKIHRAYYATLHFTAVMPKYFNVGVNLETLLKHRKFYLTHLGRRYQACEAGKIKMQCEGRCGTENERIAYVRRPLGFISDTIHFCSEYFETDYHSIQEIVHEMGRLEDIGDSSEWDTDNIFVWDRITDMLGNPQTFADLQSLSKLH